MPFYPPAPGFYPRRAAWTPATLTSLRLWVDDSSLVPDGFLTDRVAQWTDLSGHGNHLVQANINRMPFLVTAAQNGRDGALFDPVPIHWMECLTFNALANATRHTTWIICWPFSPAAANQDLLTDNESNGGLWLEQGSNQFYNTPVTAAGGYGIFAQAAAAAVMLTSVFDGTLTGNANRLKVWKNGAPLAAAAYSGTIGAAVGAEAGGLKVGRRFSSETLLYDGYILEMGICAAALNSSQLDQLHTYANAKWAVW